MRRVEKFHPLGLSQLAWTLPATLSNTAAARRKQNKRFERQIFFFCQNGAHPGTAAALPRGARAAHGRHGRRESPLRHHTGRVVGGERQVRLLRRHSVAPRHCQLNAQESAHNAHAHF